MAKVIGIDLGTTNSAWRSWRAATRSSSPTPRAAGPRPRWWRSPRMASGWWARWPSARPSPTPRNTIFSIKRFMGRKYGRGVRMRCAGALQGGRAATNGDAMVKIQDKELLAARDLRDDPAEDEADRRGLPGREGHQGGDHRAGLLQRQPAPGHQGRRQDRRAGGAAHHQRAHRGQPGLRPGQEEGRDGSRSSTWAAARSTSRSWSWARACSRSSPPTATPTWAATTSTSG